MAANNSATTSRWSDIRSYTDYVMLLITLTLFAFGVAAIYSASLSMQRGGVASPFAARQLLWGVVSAVVYVFILKVSYRSAIKAVVPLFGITVAVLIVLLAVGYTSKGAQSWFNLGFFRIQPSEFGKIVFAIVLASLCTKTPPTDAKGIVVAVGVSGIMILLILLQPDLGSALVYSVMLFAVLIVAGAPVKFLLGLIGCGLAALPLGWLVLKPYQRLRLMVFIDPTVDPQGAGYNVIQSRIAVGSGGLWGKGFLQGTQGKLHFLPEPHTDFIFSVFAEEFGFIGSLIVLTLFLLLLWKIVSTALYTKDPQAKLMCTAISAWLWFQTTESVAMSMGLAPVTGLPLPLFSYGGSSLLAVAAALALVQSVVIVEKEDRF
jgi:rod shape determining protein RodA